MYCSSHILEDHPMTCKWLITYGDRFRPQFLGLFPVPLTNGRTSWLVNGGDPNHLLSGMVLPR